MVCLLHTLLWVVACVYGQCPVQDLPPSDHGMDLLAEWTEAVQVAKPTPVPVVGTGKYPADESGWAHGSSRLMLQRIEFSCHCLSPRWLKCYKSPTVIICTDKLYLMRSRNGFAGAVSCKGCLHPQQWLLSKTQASPCNPAGIVNSR